MYLTFMLHCVTYEQNHYILCMNGAICVTLCNIYITGCNMWLCVKHIVTVTHVCYTYMVPHMCCMYYDLYVLQIIACMLHGVPFVVLLFYF